MLFADDMTVFLYNLESVKVVMELFKEFYRYAGLKLNKKKTQKLLHYNPLIVNQIICLESNG